MALTATQKAQIFKIFGVPQGGSGHVVGNLVNLYGPDGETYDFSAVVTKLNAQITALTAEQETIVAALLAEWETITDYSELRVGADGASAGRLADHDARRAKIKETLANLLGFALINGGFMDEVARARRTHRIVR